MPKFTTLDQAQAGDHIIWQPILIVSKYDIMHMVNGPFWCMHSFCRATKTITRYVRNPNVPIPTSLEEAEEYLAALYADGWSNRDYNIKQVPGLGEKGKMSYSIVREIEEDEDAIIIYATMQNDEVNDTSFKKYSGKRDDRIIILDKT
jgi:hypothetical protein